MCDPVTMTVVAVGALAGAKVFEGYQAAKLQRYQAKVSDRNAAQAVEQGAFDETRFQDEARLAIASQKAALAKSGARIDTGTPLLLLAASARNAELDVLEIRRAAAQQAEGFRTQASLRRREAGNSITSGYIGAATSILAGAAQISGLSAAGGAASSSVSVSKGLGGSSSLSQGVIPRANY